MSGTFRESFTKEDAKEDLLRYDDTAFYYFVITILVCVAVPWTLSLASSLVFPCEAKSQTEFPRRSSSGCTFHYCATSAMVAKVEEARKRARAWTRRGAFCVLMKGVLLVSIWIGVWSMVVHLRTSGRKEINKFDPFVLLDVLPDASSAHVKRAYRKLSLTYHPDKNPDDPLAASRFIQISKAYAALTDEVSRRNWERYGNPDGPHTTKVGIGLPRFLLRKENSLYILCGFFFVIIIVTPTAFICFFSSAKNYAANGVLIETLQFLGYHISESTRTKACPELLAACAESRSMPMRPTDNQQIQKLAGHVVEHRRRVFTLPIVMKNQYLLWAHMQRQHARMSPELRQDCDEILRRSTRVTQAMIEISCMRECFVTTQAMIDFRRFLVQALDVRSSQLLQVPHFTEEHVELCRNDCSHTAALAEFLALSADRRKALLADAMSPAELADVEAFCSHVGEVDVRAEVDVEDESEIVVGDVATCHVLFERKHLRPDEATGPVHSPFFPEPKLEEWWLFLVEDGEKSRIVHYERILDTGSRVELQLHFQVMQPGRNKFVLYASCDSYAGLDKRRELAFDALAEDEHPRVYRVHAEDVELDLQPTLFQQWMGAEAGRGADEDESDDPDGGGGGEEEEEEEVDAADLEEDEKGALKPGDAASARMRSVESGLASAQGAAAECLAAPHRLEAWEANTRGPGSSKGTEDSRRHRRKSLLRSSLRCAGAGGGGGGAGRRRRWGPAGGHGRVVGGGRVRARRVGTAGGLADMLAGGRVADALAGRGSGAGVGRPTDKDAEITASNLMQHSSCSGVEGEEDGFKQPGEVATSLADNDGDLD